MNITLIILTLIFAFGFVVVAYDQFALKRDWTVKSWMRGNSFPKLSAVFSIFMAPALAFYMLSWWAPIIVIVAGFGSFFLLVRLLKQHVQLVAVAGLTIGWGLFATLLVQV